MDFSALLDIFLHLDKHLEMVVQNYGVWVYALMFAIIFIETGLVVMPFLPGIRCCSWPAPSRLWAGWICPC